MGANPAENHPCGFKWALEARDRHGATDRDRSIRASPALRRWPTSICKFVRAPTSRCSVASSAMCSKTTSYHDEYVQACIPMRPLIVGEGFELRGRIVLGLRPGHGNRYDKDGLGLRAGQRRISVRRDPTLATPALRSSNCSENITIATRPRRVAQIAGCSAEEFLRIAEDRRLHRYGRSASERSCMPSDGPCIRWVPRSSARRRSFSFLLGNIGRPGGGINALRGHANVQGATDHAVIASGLPGYLKLPQTRRSRALAAAPRANRRPQAARRRHDETIGATTPSSWSRSSRPGSERAATAGRTTTATSTWGNLRATPPGSPSSTGRARARWKASSSSASIRSSPVPDVPRLLDAMSKLKWKVTIDPFMLDSAEFWKAPGMKSEEIDTEVLFLPASSLDRTRRFVHQQRALGAVEGKGDRAAPRRQVRHLDRLGAFLAHQGTVRKRRRGLPRTHRQAHLELRSTSASLLSKSWRGRSTATTSRQENSSPPSAS